MHKAIVELQERGLIHQSTDLQALSDILDSGKAVYCGFDPTADSLHVGSFLPLTVLKIFRNHNVPVIAVVGGATGRIGDPSFKAQERNVLSNDILQKNLDGITKVIKSVLGDDDNVYITNNYDWAREMNVIDFMRLYGKCFTVNNMINKESVKNRIDRPGQGISFAEFSYPIIQGMDFHYLYQVLDCGIQVGGSDQWGNMIAGTDIIHKLHPEANVGVITLPLLTKDDGTKFGKTESGTVWLSPDKTTPYQFMQFWMNVSDTEMLKMYRMFKPLSFSTESVEREMEHNPVLMKRQFAIAMTNMIHGSELTTQAVKITDFFFDQNAILSDKDMDSMVQGGIQEFSAGVDLVETLVLTGLAKSKKMAREFIQNGAVKVDGIKVHEAEQFDSLNKRFVLQRGKNNFVVVNK